MQLRRIVKRSWPVTDSLASLPVRWRDEAATLRHRGAESQAALLEQVADELEAGLLEQELEALTLKEAAAESGYSYSAIQKMVACGELLNVGDKHRPRLRRGDLPRKPRRASEPRDAEPDLVGTILANGR